MPDLSLGYDTSSAPGDMAVFLRAAEAGERSAKALETIVDKLGKTTRRTGREQQTAAQKAEQYTRAQKLVAQIMRDTGVSHTAAARAVRVFGKDLDRAEKEAAQYARQMDIAEKEVRQLVAAQRAAAREAKGAGSGMSFAQSHAAALARSLVAAAAAAFGVHQALRLLGDSKDAALQLQAINRGLSASVGGGQAAAEEYAFLRGEVERLGLVLPSAAKDLTLLSAAAKGTELAGAPVRDLFSTLSGVAGVLSLSADDLSGAFVQLSQGISKGKFELEDLKSVFERIPGSAEAMARGLGVSRAEMFAMQTAGKLLAKDAIPALVKGLQEVFGGQIAAGAQSDQAAINRLETAIFEFKAELGAGLMPALAAATKEMTAWLALHHDTAREIGELVGGSLTALLKILGAVADNWEMVAVAIAALKFQSLVSAITSVTAALVTQTAALRAWLLSAGGLVVVLAAAGLAANAVAVAYGQRMAREIEAAAASTVRFRNEQDKLTEAIKSGNRALIEGLLTEYTAKAATAAADLAAAESEIADATSHLAEAQAKLNEARKKGGTDRQMGLGSEIQNLISGYPEAKKAVDEYASALNRAQQARGNATIDDRAAKEALDALQKALKGIGLKEHRDRLDDVTKKQTQWLAKLAEEVDALRRAAKDNYALGSAQEFGAQAVEEFGDALEIQRKVLSKVSEAERQGTADTAKFRAAIKEYEAALRDAVEAERYLAGKETLARLKDQIAVEQALLAITSAGPAAVDALAKALDRERQILEATAKAAKSQVAEIEARMRRLFALQDARAVASQIQAIRQEIEETRRLTAARAQGTAAAEAEVAQIQLENDLRTAAAGGINLMTLALMALIQARAQEAAQARQSSALQNLKDEIELLRLRNRVMREGLRSGLSQGEAQRKGDLAAQVERMRKETGLARDVIAGFVDEQTRLNDEFERTVSMLEYSGAVLDRIAGIMSQMGGTVGEIGQALGGVSQGFAAIQSGMAAGGFIGGLDIVSGAMALTAAANAMATSLGLVQGQRGTGRLGGDLSGDLAGGGGGTLGPVFGLINTGADEFLATILDFGNGLVATIDKAEGGLGAAGDTLIGGIADVFASLQAAVGGAVNVAGVQLKIRDDVVTVFVNGIKGAFEGETAIEDAVTFAVSEMLKTADFGAGISDTMQAILRNGFESLDQLQAAVDFGNRLDDLLASPLDRFMNAMNRSARELLATATQLGVPIQTVVAAMEAQTQAALDVSRAAVLAAAGLDPSIEQWKALQAQIDQVSEDAVAKLQDDLRALAQAALDAAAAAGTGSVAFDGSRESFDAFMVEMGISGDRADQLRARFEDLARAGVPAEQIVADLTLALQGLDSAQIRQAIDRFRSQFLGGLYDQMAQLARAAGNQKLAAEFAAKAEDFRFVAMMISARVTIAAAQAEGLMSAARAAALNLQLDNLARLRRELAQSGAGRGGSRGRGAPPTTGPDPTTDADREAEEAARRAADAAREFADTLALLESRSAGVTDTARAYADQQARLLELYREGSVPLADYARALEMMAQLHLEDIAADWAGAAQSMRHTDLQAATLALRDRAQQAWADALLAAADNPAAYERAAQAIAEGLEAELHDLGRQALGELGSEFVRLRREGTATVREIRYLAQHLEEFGLTAQQLARVVREGILPGLLDMAIAEAERVGDTERAIELRQQQAAIERRLQLLQISLWQAQLEAAGALDAATRAIIDQLVIDLGRVSAGGTVPGTEGPLRPRFPDERLGGRGGGGEAGGAAPRTVADIIDQLRGDLETPAQRIRREFQDMLDAIAEASGSAAEKAEAARLAEEKFQRERLRGLMDLRDQILGAQAQDQPASRAIEQARAAFDAAVAAGDEGAILEAAQRWLDAAADFPTLLRSAQAAILAGLGPVFAGGTPSLSTPAPSVAGFAGLSALPPPLSLPTPPAGQAPDLRGLESRIEALTREVAALRSPISRTAKATEATATGVLPLRDLGPVLERRL